MDFSKYKWKARLLIINTPSYKNKDYLLTKDIYQKYIKDFHKRFVKLVTKINKNNDFNIYLIGFDGVVKKKFKKLEYKKIFSLIDKMPLKNLKNNKNFKPLNLSLFSDYKPETTTYGLGFKDKEKALYTIKAIKTRPIKYQVNVIATMLGRAKNHPNRTNSMNDAITIFSKWMKEYKISKI
tara:strand:+ start:196 stop:738 length:543 start_codon:yes stop_codon:yes gene_type:complete